MGKGDEPMSHSNESGDSFRDEIEIHCDRFEAEWKTGAEPEIKKYLAGAPESARHELAGELLRLDIHYRRNRGDTILATDYKSFPEHASLVDKLLGPSLLPESPIEQTHAGRYHLEGQIGHGGMGDVCRAHDPDFRRPLAVKILKKQYKDSRDLTARFLEEAQITGQLQHPGVPPVHEIGRLPDGRPFLAMKLIEGRTLADLLDERPSPSDGLPRFLAIFEQICQTLAYAHSRGVIHRDLKPANIMVGAFGEVQVMDWGLAKVRSLASRADESLEKSSADALQTPSVETVVEPTQQGAVLGTLAYIPPEQARGEVELVDERSDVFGLGAILCVILTGQPPYCGASRQELHQRAVSTDLADAFARLTACGADGEVVTLARQCLTRERGDRPSNAAKVAEAITAYQASVQERLRRAELDRAEAEVAAKESRKRRRLAATFVALVLLVLAGGFLATYFQYLDTVEQKQQAEKLAIEKGLLADKNQALADTERVLKTNAETLADEKTKLANQVQRELARLAVQEGLGLCENQSDSARGLPCLVYGLETAEKAGEPELAHAIRTNLTVWSRNLMPQRAVLIHENWPEIHRAIFSPDGRLVATACGDGAIRLWETATGKPVGQPFGTPRRPQRLAVPKDSAANPERESIMEIAPEDDPAFSVAFSPDGHWIAGGSLRGRVRLWEVTTGRLLREFQHHDGAKDKAFRSNLGKTLANNGIVGLAFRADGKALIAAGHGGLVRIWDPSNGAKLTDLPHPGAINTVVLSPDGRSLLVGCALRDPNVGIRGLALLWDATTGKLRYNPLPHIGDVHAVAFSPDGRWFATGCRWGQAGRAVGEARLWETASGKPVGQPSRFGGFVNAVAFSPDGRHWLAAGSDGTVRLFDGESGVRFEGRLGGPPAADGPDTRYGKGIRIAAAAFSPDGRTFVTSGQGIQAWDVAGMSIGEMLKVHRSSVHHVSFSSDGRTLLTAAHDGTARLWEAPTSRAPPGRSLHLSTNALRVVFSRDSRRVLIGTMGRGALLFEPGGSKPPVPLEHDTGTPEVDLSPDGRLALTGSYDRTARLWDAATGIKLGELTGVDRVLAVAFSPDSQMAAVSGRAFNPDGGGVYLWDVPTRQPRATRILKGVSVPAIAFSPDSRVLAATDGSTVRFYRVSDCDATGIALEHGDKVEVVAFSPDGALVLTAGGSAKARLWDAATGKALRDFAHRKAVVAALFSSDGQTVLTASLDGTAQAWRTATGEPCGPPLIHRQPVTAAALSRDGRTVLTGCRDGSVRLWDARAGLPISPPLQHAGEVRCAALSPDGRTAIWGGMATTLDFRTLPPDLPCSTEGARFWAHALTGFTHDADHAVRLLEPERWQECRDWLRRNGEELLAIEDVPAWHRREAEECELTMQWFPAQWHLQRMLDDRPNDSELLRRRGVAAARLGWWDRAAEMLTSAIARGADSAEVRLERGKAFLQLGRRDQAEADFSTGVQRWPDAWGPWQARGSMRAEAGQWREAAEDLRRAAELPGAPLFVGSQHAIACLRLRDLAGYHTACAALVRRLGRGEAWNDLVRQTPDVVWPCCLCRSTGAEPTRLRQLAEQAADPSKGSGMENYPLVRALGASLYRAGEYQRAVHVLGMATKLNDQAPTVWLLMAMSHHRLGNAQEARRALDAARRWLAQSRLEEALAYRVAWATGIAANLGGPGPASAFAAFAGFPLGEIGKSEKRARPWRQLPWPEQQALEMLRFEAENLFAGKHPAGKDEPTPAPANEKKRESN
jgi:WD40 repeat protein/tetratricopeptide (TPR) repeat protein